MLVPLTSLAPFAGIAFLIGFALYCLCQAVREGSWRASLRRLGLTCMIVLSVLAFRGARLAGAKVGGGTNETNRAGVAQRAPARASVAEADAGMALVDALRFTSIVRTPSNVAFTVHSPSNGTDDGYDVFMRPRLESGGWTWLSYFTTSSFAVPLSTLDALDPYAGTNGTYSAAGFFTLGSVRDTDGDGLSDARETLVYGTSPARRDSDFDGLPDGEEVNAYGTDPRNPHSLDASVPDGLALRAGGWDLFACPPGSTNAVWEHVFYTGRRDAPFTYPESSPTAVVLRVSAAPGVRGTLGVGDRAVPLFGAPDDGDGAGGAAQPVLLLSIPRGVRQELVLRLASGAPGDVLLASDDFAYGELPDGPVAGGGWLVFPDTRADEPCIHDFGTRRKRVALAAAGDGAGALTCAWHGAGTDVTVANEPPRAALVTADFPAHATREIAYTLGHPQYLFGRTTYAQTVRFCPQPAEGDSAPEPPPWFAGGGEGGGDGTDVRDENWCCWWGRCRGGDGACSCGCGDAGGPCGGSVPGDGSLATVCPLHGLPYEQCAPAHDAAYAEAVQNAAPCPGVLKIRDPLAYERIGLPCPSGGRKCCDCPDHGTDYVALAYGSRRLKVVDGAGDDFVRSGVPCFVRVAGVRPSSAVGDATLGFVTNGVVFRTFGYTVLGVGFAKPDGPPLAVYNRLSPALGVPMTVTTNVNNALQLDVLSNVRLPSGSVRFSIGADGDARFAVWMYDYAEGRYWKILDTEERPVVNLPLADWRRLVGGSSQPDSPVTPIYVTSAAKGSATLRFGYWDATGDGLIEDWCEQKVTSVDPPLLPDYNRDGRVDSADVASWQDGRHLYFWSNDDTWRGDDAFAGYGPGVHLWPFGLPKNGTDMLVNGRNDLVNFCPFAVDLRDIYACWGDEVLYEFFTGDPGNVRFALARTKWDSVGDMVKADQRTLDAALLHEAPLATTVRNEAGGEVGHALPRTLLELGGQGRGVVAAEFADPGPRSLAVRIRRRGTDEVLFSSAVDVRVLDVHAMYRWLNLDYVCGVETDAVYATRMRVEWPDAEHADANVVFVHGYNVHPSEQRDWAQAMFKRLWWSGLDAGFTAVLWRGNQTQVWVPGENAYATKNYHQNVINAFRTAAALAAEAEDLPGARKYFIAHSLGNMLVSAARQDHGLRYEKYFMLNAAVAVEAYDADGGVTQKSKHDMTPPEWRAYPDRVRATHWYGLFQDDADDARGRLTWKGRFRDVDGTVNFYSSQDEVVANGDDRVDEVLARKFAWYNQEMAKGGVLVDLVPEAGWCFAGSYRASFVMGYSLDGAPIYSTRLYTAAEAAGIAADDLRTRPFFRDFTRPEIYGAGGSDYLLSNDQFRWRTLSHGIPAESFAAGANPVPKWGSPTNRVGVVIPSSLRSRLRNVNMASEFKDHRGKWIHSYFISAPLLDTHELFERIVDDVK